MSEHEDLTEDGRWILTCSCGNAIRQKNLIYRGSSAPCTSCAPIMAGEDEMFDQPSVTQELGWCGCGTPDRVDELMLRYLLSVPRWEHPEHGIPEDEWMLLSYMADSLGWTEHGTSVGGAWLTDEGQAVISRLKGLVAASDAPSP